MSWQKIIAAASIYVSYVGLSLSWSQRWYLPTLHASAYRQRPLTLPLLTSMRASCQVYMPDMRPQKQARTCSGSRKSQSQPLQLCADQILECQECRPHLMHRAGDCTGAGIHAAELAVPHACQAQVVGVCDGELPGGWNVSAHQIHQPLQAAQRLACWTGLLRC